MFITDSWPEKLPTGGYMFLCVVSSPLDAAEGVLISLLGLNLKVKGSSCGGTSGEVDARDLLKAQVHGGFVDIDEAPLQGIEEAWGRFVGAGDALSSRMTAEEQGTFNRIFSSMLENVFWKGL